METHKSSPKEIGKRIKKLRKEHKLKQTDLARILGVSETTMNYYEIGEREIPAKHIVTLYEKFDISCDKILHDTDAKNIFLHSEYGLSDEALDTLRAFHSAPPEFPIIDGHTPNRIAAANTLLENVEVFDLISRFLAFNTKWLEEDGELGKCKLAILSETQGSIELNYSPKDLSFALFAQLQQALIELRKKYRHDDGDKRTTSCDMDTHEKEKSIDDITDSGKSEDKKT